MGCESGSEQEAPTTRIPNEMRNMIFRRRQEVNGPSFRSDLGRLVFAGAVLCATAATVPFLHVGDEPRRGNRQTGKSVPQTGRVETTAGEGQSRVSSGSHVQPNSTRTDSDNIAYKRAGLTVARDSTTGVLKTPTANELQALRLGPGLNRSMEGLKEVVLRNGTVAVDLQGRFRSLAVARIADDGSIVTGCVTTAEEAAVFLGASRTRRSAQAEAGDSRGNGGQDAP